MLDNVIAWLAASAVSQWVQSTPWVIPTLQSVHILSISAVMATSFILALKVFGVLPALQPLADLVTGAVRVIWGGIAMLLLSGSFLVVAEPADILLNTAFQMKMLVLLAAAVLLLLCPRAVDSRPKLKWLAGSSLTLMLTLVVAGRWIAYS